MSQAAVIISYYMQSLQAPVLCAVVYLPGETASTRSFRAARFSLISSETGVSQVCCSEQ